MTNKEVRELEDKIIAVLNASSVQIEVKRLIISNVYHLVTKEADKTIVAESLPKQKEEKK